MKEVNRLYAILNGISNNRLYLGFKQVVVVCSILQARPLTRRENSYSTTCKGNFKRSFPHLNRRNRECMVHCKKRETSGSTGIP